MCVLNSTANEPPQPCSVFPNDFIRKKDIFYYLVKIVEGQHKSLTTPPTKFNLPEIKGQSSKKPTALSLV
jgi:hypothetical protein